MVHDVAVDYVEMNSAVDVAADESDVSNVAVDVHNQVAVDVVDHDQIHVGYAVVHAHHSAVTNSGFAVDVAVHHVVGREQVALVAGHDVAHVAAADSVEINYVVAGHVAVHVAAVDYDVNSAVAVDIDVVDGHIVVYGVAVDSDVTICAVAFDVDVPGHAVDSLAVSDDRGVDMADAVDQDVAVQAAVHEANVDYVVINSAVAAEYVAVVHDVVVQVAAVHSVGSNSAVAVAVHIVAGCQIVRVDAADSAAVDSDVAPDAIVVDDVCAVALVAVKLLLCSLSLMVAVNCVEVQAEVQPIWDKNYNK